ncbi:MAG: AGE family epimerase/isomerase [Candidatus Dormibacter sp.]|uniref:AGE family epimerase/isomerase n=1 Tax=Candidatus Dormibacter sp. TaxID=2973982 RepID=UPI0026C2DDC0
MRIAEAGPAGVAPNGGWLGNPLHESWLLAEANRLLDFYQYACVDPGGGFFELDSEGVPAKVPNKEIVVSARMTYTFSLAHLMGRPGAGAVADHGIRFLLERHRDPQHGGYYWTAGADRPIDSAKQGYGHAHVLLAAATAVLADRPEGDRLLQDVTEVLDRRFWSEEEGLFVEEFPRDWAGGSGYRGQNSNMHMVEGLLAAHDATGESEYLRRALSVCRRLITEKTASNDWRLAEHYTADWEIDPDYNRDDPDHLYRPYGSIVGHWLEWARLLCQAWAATGNREAWCLESARRLFRQALSDGWNVSGEGLIYTVDFQGRPLSRDRYWWTFAEALGAAAYLADVTGVAEYERWYRTFWDFTHRHVIDHRRGGWHAVLDSDNQPKSQPWSGKPDLYHALHACLLPLLPTDRGLAVSLRQGLTRSGAARGVR